LFRTAQPAGVPSGAFREGGKILGARAYIYNTGDEEHWMLFASAGNWTVNEWSSDAGFVYWGYDRKRDRGMLVFCGGTQVSFAGRQIVVSSNVPFCEIIREQGNVRVLGANPDEIIVRDHGLETLVASMTAGSALRFSEQAGR
jgi:hypothetical protein